MTYNKIKYWNSRVDENNDFCRTITGLHVDKVKPFISPNSKILEYGPGTGRMIDVYSEQNEINFYDISDMYKTRLIENCEKKNLSVDNHIIDKSGNIKTNFNDNEFDVVCAFEVLIHSPEHEIELLINELSRIGKKVIIITWYDGGKKLSSDYCWTRDYKNLLIKNNLKLIHWDEKSFIKQVLFIYEK